MTAVVTAVVGSTLVSAYTANQAGKTAAKAADKANETQKEISDESLLLQKELTEQQRKDFQSWRTMGEQALNSVWSGINNGSFDVGKIDVTQDPGYQFRLDEGTKATNNALIASGYNGSGAQGKALTRYAQNYASNEYASAYARELEAKNRKYNMLSAISDYGLNAAARQGGATAQLASTSANILGNQATNSANLISSAGNARATGYSNVGAALNQGAKNYLTYDLLKTQG